MFSDYVNVDPAFAVDQFGSTNVVHISTAVGLVLLTVIVKANHRLVIAHIEKRLAYPVGDSDLGTWWRQPVVNQDQSYSRFLR